MIVRLATYDDDVALTALMESVAMPGPLRLAFGCRPSFFQALRVAGGAPLVCVAEQHGDIVAAGAVTSRKVFFNGRVAALRYLSALRVAPQARGSAALARGFTCLREALAGQPGDVTLTSIMRENTNAVRVLTGGRAGLPPYEPLCGCVTRVMAAGRAVKEGRSNHHEVAAGAGVHEIAGFIHRHGPARNFFPVCGPEDLDGRVDGAFPGLTADDFLVARDDGGILGIMACWDVTRFRQALVSGYDGWLRWARPWLNLGARWSGGPSLPRAGAALGLAYAALTLIPDNNPAVLRGLLDAALAWTRRRGRGYLVMALSASDPLAGGCAGLAQREMHSRIFRVHFEPPGLREAADGRVAHFEGAML